MKIHFLGTNGWYDTATGNTACTLIDSKEAYIILDAGNGIYKVDKFIKSSKPVYLFISHFHLDHIIGLHILNKFNFRQGLHIYGQPGTRQILGRFVTGIFTAPFSRLDFRVRVSDLSEGWHKIPFLLECKFLKHISRCMGYRLVLEDRVIAYCTDTGYCKNAVYLARNADLLIAECSYKNARQSGKWPHLDPYSAASIAREAGAKKLIFTHFDAEVYLALKERKEARKKARSIFDNTIAAEDDLVIKI